MNIRDYIGVGLIFAFIGALFALFYKEIPKTNEQIIVYMIGQLSGFVSAVVALHYTAKAGEKELDKQRADNTSKALDAITAVAKTSPPNNGEAQDVNVAQVGGEEVKA